jgi:hypothetical protein
MQNRARQGMAIQCNAKQCKTEQGKAVPGMISILRGPEDTGAPLCAADIIVSCLTVSM